MESKLPRGMGFINTVSTSFTECDKDMIAYLKKMDEKMHRKLAEDVDTIISCNYPNIHAEERKMSKSRSRWRNWVVDRLLSADEVLESHRERIRRLTEAQQGYSDYIHRLELDNYTVITRLQDFGRFLGKTVDGYSSGGSVHVRGTLLRINQEDFVLDTGDEKRRAVVDTIVPVEETTSGE